MFRWKRFWYWLLGWEVLYTTVIAANGSTYGLFLAIHPSVEQDKRREIYKEWHVEVERLKGIGSNG